MLERNGIEILERTTTEMMATFWILDIAPGTTQCLIGYLRLARQMVTS